MTGEKKAIKCNIIKAKMLEKILLYKWPNLNIPRHLLTIDDAEILKKVVLHSVATAFASIVWNEEVGTQIS